MAGLSDDDLLRQIDSEESQALGAHSGDLSRERELALDAYHGHLSDVKAPEEGRSSVVSTDVRDAVDGMLPDVLDIFLSSDDVVEFEPQGLEDEQAAKQATEACNYVFHRQNGGALKMYEWFKTAFLEKNGVVKYYHEKYGTPQIETYEAQNDLELQMLVNQPGVTILEHNSYDDPAMRGMHLHDVRARIVDQHGKTCIDGVPSEEFLICRDHRSLSLRDVRFVEHRRTLTVSQIREMGIDVDLADVGVERSAQMSPEYAARRRHAEELELGPRNSADPSQKEGEVCEISMLVDRDGDGYAERRRIVKIGKRIYQDDYADHVPFAAICPVIMPYRFHGLSIADLVYDIMKIKTAILRGSLDSLYHAITPRIGVMENMVNLDDLLVSRPAGVVRFKGPPSQLWSPIEHRFVGQQAFPMIEYMDSVKENRTGFTRYSQGTDADSLNKTAHGMQLITSASAKRLKLIARMFAETGVKDLMQGIKHLLVKHRSGKPLVMRLRGQWANVDPREWKTQWDMTVNVGLGTNDKTMQAAQIQQIMGVQKAIREAGMTHLVSDSNIYNSAKRLAETAGYKQPEEFFTAPSEENPPPQPQPAPEVVKAQLEAEVEREKMASDERKKEMEVANGENVARIQQETSIAVADIKAASDAESQRLKADTDRAINSERNEHAAEVEIFRQGGAKPGKRGAQETSLADALVIASQGLMKAAEMMMAANAAPKEVVRDAQGNIVGVRPVLSQPQQGAQ